MIFDIEIYIVAISIHDNPAIKRVLCGSWEHKYALFVDDMLLFVTSPLTPIPNMLDLSLGLR